MNMRVGDRARVYFLGGAGRRVGHRTRRFRHPMNRLDWSLHFFGGGVRSKLTLVLLVYLVVLWAWRTTDWYEVLHMTYSRLPSNLGTAYAEVPADNAVVDVLLCYVGSILVSPVC